MRAKVPTDDGHQIKVTESGRFVRCSTCEELAEQCRKRYKGVLANNPDLEKQLQDLVEKAKDPSLAEKAVEEAAELEKQLRLKYI